MSWIRDIVNQILRILHMDQIGQEIQGEVSRNYDKGMERVEVMVDMNFTRLPDKVEYLQEYMFDNIKGMTNEIAERLRKELHEGLQNLENIRQLQERVQKVMDVAENRALVIARTEQTRAENMGMMDAARESGIELRKYLSVHEDDRTSPICRAMNKKYGLPQQAIPLDGIFKVTVKDKLYQGDAPPFHPNCRSAVVFTQAE